MKRRSLVSAATLSLLTLSLLGCASDDQDDEMAATTAALHAEGLATEGLDDVDAADPREAAAAAAQPRPGDAGCRTRVLDAQDPTVVHVHLSHCPKRFGRHILDGEIRLTFSVSPSGALHVERRGVGLTLDGAPAGLEGSADVFIGGTDRRILGQSRWTTTRPDGAVRVHDGQHEVTVDRATRCRVSTGSATITEDGAPFATSTSEVAFCRLADGTDTCPTGLVEHERTTGKHVTKRFDGTATAVATITRGHGPAKTKSIPLVCTAR